MLARIEACLNSQPVLELSDEPGVLSNPGHYLVRIERQLQLYTSNSRSYIYISFCASRNGQFKFK